MTQIYKAGSGGGGGGLITTINGDIGSITGSTVTIFADNAANNSGSTVLFNNSGTVSTLNLTDSNSNTILGSGSGLLASGATFCAGIGTGSATQIDTGATKVYFLGDGCLTSLINGQSIIAIGNGVLASSVSDSGNLGIGDNSLATLNGGSLNWAVGIGTLQNSDSDNQNCAGGWGSLQQLSGGGAANNNAAFGFQTMTTASTSSNCCAYGSNSMASCGTASNTSAYGFQSFQNCTGNNNTGVGANVGSALNSTESNNAYLNSPGQSGDNNTLRIGSGTGAGTQQLNKAFISGINGNTISSPVAVTIDPTTDQLGTQPLTPSGAFQWTGEASDFNAVVGNGYYIVSGCTATLPTSPADGSTIGFINVSAGINNFLIEAGGSNQMQIGISTSSPGGTFTSTQNGDAVILVYFSTAASWFGYGSQGSFTPA